MEEIHTAETDNLQELSEELMRARIEDFLAR